MLDRETTDALALRDLTGQVTRVPLVEVTSSRPFGRSPTPEGLLGSLSADEVRDLKAHLQWLR